MSVRENLIAAKALIDTPEKWGKSDWAPKSGTCLCSLGAVVVATNGNYDFDNAWTTPVLEVEKVLARSLPAGLVSVAEYNDDPDTTHADIMALFDRAIQAQEERGNG